MLTTKRMRVLLASGPALNLAASELSKSAV